MRVVATRFLRGPNVHDMQPCHVAVVDLEALDGVAPSSLPRLVDALGARLGDEAASLGEAPDMADLVARVVRRLQALAGMSVTIGRAARAASSPSRQWSVVSGYRLEAVVERAVTVAVGWIDAIVRGEPFDAAGAILDLCQRAQARAIDAASEGLLEAACARGIPVLRLRDDERVFQLGWGARQHRFEAAAPGDAAPVPATALDQWFAPGDDGRIPTVAITGTNGKTTTTLLIAHVVRLSGACTGTTTTQGVFVDGQAIEVGDCTGYWSARRVLTHEAVDVATLETARGGLLKRGLAFDRCDVGVVLNVSADHLGLDGVETLDDLAHVKGLVARCAASSAVLNAEDERCVGMRASLREGCRPVFFSMDPLNVVLLEHLEHGGAAAFLDDGWLAWCEAGRTQRVAEAATLPFTLQGHARYNVANALAALAALRCMGFEPAAIAAGLSTFVSDARSNPLRANQFEVGGVRLLLDYAHNVAAYRALCQAARSMLGGRGRLLGVITSPGDRRAGDLFETGRVCGEGFDELVVYEQDPRGRGMGETTQAILAGARSAAPSKPLHGQPRIRAALRDGLALARDGDILVFTCAGTFDDLVEGVRLVDPAAAQRIASEIH